MHGADLGGIERGVIRIAHRQDVTEGLTVPLDLQERLLVRADRLLAVDRGRRVILRDLISLDAVRTLDGARQSRTSQHTFPALRSTKHMAQVFAHPVDLAQDRLVLARERIYLATSCISPSFPNAKAASLVIGRWPVLREQRALV
jgi:hypothetical protein